MISFAEKVLAVLSVDEGKSVKDIGKILERGKCQISAALKKLEARCLARKEKVIKPVGQDKRYVDISRMPRVVWKRI